MTVQNHRNGDISLTLSKDDAQRLFRLVRDGRKAIVNDDKNYDSGFAIDIMQALRV